MKDNVNWLVIGGSGYIGSHISRYFKHQKLNTFILDNLSTGLKNRNPDNIEFFNFDCRETTKLNLLLKEKNIKGVVHLAALKQARESFREPLKYWTSNLESTISILNSFKNSPVKYLLFSSSCSIYGGSEEVIEGNEPNPLSPYAWTKLCSEKIISDAAKDLGLSWISLRYFNVIGNSDFPFAHDNSNECLVPAIFSKIKSGKLAQIYGTNFPTPDGTALRDYMDVRDLAEVHFLAANYLIKNQSNFSLELNVGRGKPISVLEILNKICASLKINVEYENIGRNPADPPAIWANTNKFRELFKWEPKYSLEDSINSYMESFLK